MAAPHIAGLVSVLKSFDPSLDTQAIKTLFSNNSIATTSVSGKYIPGVVDVESVMSAYVVEEEVEVPVVDEPVVGEPIVETGAVEEIGSSETLLDEKVLENSLVNIFNSYSGESFT
jgi:hypothetical protein